MKNIFGPLSRFNPHLSPKQPWVQTENQKQQKEKEKSLSLPLLKLKP